MSRASRRGHESDAHSRTRSRQDRRTPRPLSGQALVEPHSSRKPFWIGQPMTITVRISRSDRQWVADVPQARGLVAWSPSLSRLRKQVDRALREFYPALAKHKRTELFELSRDERALLENVAHLERVAKTAQARAASVKRQASRRLRSRLGISIREVGALMGVSGARAQQLLRR